MVVIDGRGEVFGAEGESEAQLPGVGDLLESADGGSSWICPPCDKHGFIPLRVRLAPLSPVRPRGTPIMT